jgi:hypothetical protein
MGLEVEEASAGVEMAKLSDLFWRVVFLELAFLCVWIT